MAAFLLRQADVADAPALARLAALTFPLACPPGTEEKDIAEFVAAAFSVPALRAKLADPDWFCAIAHDGSTLLAYTLTGFGPHADDGTADGATVRPTCQLSKCYVLPEAQGTSLARRLMDFTLAEARRRGAAACWLGVNDRNARAQRFYAKCGFAVVGERTFTVGSQDHHDFVMQTLLNQPEAG